MSVLDKADAVQKGTKPTSVALATFKKFKEDNTTNLAALIAFWAFFSIFPLLMVMVTVLGFVLPAHDKVTVLNRIAQMFPLLNPQKVTGLTGTWWALLLGVLTSLWSGMGGVRTVQTAFNTVWEIPRHARPGLKEQLLRSLAILGTLGVGIVATTLVSSFVTSSANGVNLGVASRIGGYVFSIIFDVGIFVAAFRMLTDREISARDVLPGSILAGVMFFVLQELSSFIISRHLKSAQSTYAEFATVITLLWWFYLQAQITLFGAQLNVVLKDRLFPRSLVRAPRTEADHRVLQAYAEERAYQPEEQVDARVQPGEQGERESSDGAGQRRSQPNRG